MIDTTRARTVLAIGLGGVAEGYLWQLASLCMTGELPMKTLCLVDGDLFVEENRTRQTFGLAGPKADVRAAQLRSLYREVPVLAFGEYVCRENMRDLITEDSVVLLSPDNHPTRRLVSEQVCTLDNCLLIVGGNDGIDTVVGTDGTVGWAYAHYRKEGRNLTAPITEYHQEIAAAEGPEPTAQSCGALIADGQTQVHRTNLRVGAEMLQLLLRYLQLPDEEAIAVGEVAVSSRTGRVVPSARPPACP